MAINCLWKILFLSRVPGIHYYHGGLPCLPHPTRSTRPLLFLDPMLLSLCLFSHSQTTLVLIKPRGLTFSPRYLECCTKSILRPCQPGNKPQVFPFWDFSTLVLLALRNKLKFGFLAAQHSSCSCSFVYGGIIFRNIILKILWHNFTVFYAVLKLFCCFILMNVISFILVNDIITIHLNFSSDIKSPTFIWVMMMIIRLTYQLCGWKISFWLRQPLCVELVSSVTLGRYIVAFLNLIFCKMWVIIKASLHLPFCKWVKDAKYLEKSHVSNQMQINTNKNIILLECFYHFKRTRN